MKRLISILISVIMLTAVLSCCADGSKEKLKVGMVTDSGTINDKSFNQGTWEGIQRAEKELGVEITYRKPGGESVADCEEAIIGLYDSGFKVIVAPGFKFETAIYEMQSQYPDATFVLLDGEPNDGDWSSGLPDYKTTSNTICYLFAEEQAGFLVGVAASVELKSGELGFIGGMSIPSVNRFNWGFQQGIAYANDVYGTNCTIKAENCIYQGTFTDKAAGQQFASTMYDRGVKAIFAAAGNVGGGVISEAGQRRKNGQDVWVIGVDVDQYDEGIYDGEKSCVLTSATKDVGLAAFDTIKTIQDGTFMGGRTVTYNAESNGIGIPANNPNLSTDTIDKINDVFTGLSDGSITVSDTGDGLIP